MIEGSPRIRVWDLPLRLFHWLLVAAIAVAFLSAEEDSALNQWHVVAGWLAGILIVFRLAWGFVGGEHSRFSDFIRPSRIGEHLQSLRHGRPESSIGHNPLGAVAVIVLLGLTGLVVATGAFGGEAAEEAHELIGWTLLAMVGVHILAVIVMSVFEGENLARAMVVGTKARVRHPAAHDARRPGAAGLLFALVVLGAAIYGVLSYDPQAFTLRTAEAFEHRAGATHALSPETRRDED